MGPKAGTRTASGHATTPAGGESGGRPHGPTRGGRSQTGLARSRTIRDFHGVPESLLRQTHAPHLTPNGGRICSGRGKSALAALLASHRSLLRPGQDGHCEVEHLDVQQVLLPRRPDQPASRVAHRVHAVHLPGRRRRPRPDGTDAGVPVRPLQGVERAAGAGDRRRDPARPHRPDHLRRGRVPDRGPPHRGPRRGDRVHLRRGSRRAHRGDARRGPGRRHPHGRG